MRARLASAVCALVVAVGAVLATPARAYDAAIPGADQHASAPLRP